MTDTPGAVFAHHVAGPAVVRVKIGEGSLVSLGYTAEGVDCLIGFKERPIWGDQMGGSDGIPVDVLMMGSDATIEVELVDFDAAVLESVLGHRGGSYGVPEAAGTLLLAGAKYIRLLIGDADTANPVNFPFAYVSGDSPFNLATKETHFKLTFKALPGSVGGTLFDDSTS
jgi:hypothetical protein